jgi:hypothetical protein
VWDVVSRHLYRPDVRTAFRDLLAAPARQNELWREAVEALTKENYRVWDALWAVVRESAGRDEAARRMEKLTGDKNEDRIGKLPSDTRAKMRAACKDVQLFPSRALLVPTGLGEAEPLLAAPPEQAGYTAFVLLAPDALGWLNHVPPPVRAQMRTRAKQFLCAAPLPAFVAYFHAAREYLNTDSHFLDVLFKPHSAPAAALLSRVLVADVLEPGHWRKLFDSAHLGQYEWGAFLLEKNHLSQVLVGLGNEGDGKDVWQAYLDSLSPALVSPALLGTEDGTEPDLVSAWERTVHAQLKLAAEKLTAGGQRLSRALPEGGVRKLIAANNLVKWVADPASAERDGTSEVHLACDAFDMKPYELVRAVLLAGGYRELDLPRELPKLEPLLVLFRTAFPADAAHNSRSAVTYWLKLSQELPKGTRAVFQSEFVLKCVPELFYKDLLAEVRTVPFEPIAIALINGVLQGKVKPKAQKPALPEPELANTKLEGSGSNKKGDYKQLRRNRRAGGNNWAYLIAGVLLIVVLIAGFLLAFK